VNSNGVAWAADRAFTGGKVYTNPSVTQIAGTTDDVLYRNERSTVANLGTFAYDIAVPNGAYTVLLHFAEIYHGATGGGAGGTGKRVFSVNFEGGATEISNLDLNAQVAPMTAYVSSNVVSVTGGNLDIDFSASVDQPTIAAIEIIPVAAAQAAAPPATSGAAATTTPPSTVRSQSSSLSTLSMPNFAGGLTAFSSIPSENFRSGGAEGGSSLLDSQNPLPLAAQPASSTGLEPAASGLDARALLLLLVTIAGALFFLLRRRATGAAGSVSGPVLRVPGMRRGFMGR
jgi:hypothetical protein